MKFTPEVLAALATLRANAENDFERHRIDVLERDLTAPPVVEIIDDRHQKFDNMIFHKNKTEHFAIGISMQRVVWQYYNGAIPEGDYEIHHKDLNPANNESSNLQLLTRSEHQRLHSRITEPQTCVCEVCGKSFQVQNRRRKLSRFCSLECRNFARWNSPRYKKVRVCVVCGKNFITDKYKTGICCSVACRQEFVASKRRKEPVQKICPTCDKVFVTKKPSQIYCSRDCYHKARGNINQINNSPLSS